MSDIFIGAHRLGMGHNIWPVIAKEGSGLVGTVQWWEPEKCYAFRPGQYQMLTPAVMKKITTFCEKQTTKYNAKRT